jgi:putative DNA primase/helicase
MTVKAKQLPVGFFVRPDGTYYREPNKPPERVSPRVGVRATVSVAGSPAKFVVVYFNDYNDALVEVKLPRADFLNLRTFRYALDNAGYQFSTKPDKAKQLHQALTMGRPNEDWEIVSRIGWHGKHFVLPNSPTRTDAGKVLRFEPNGTEHYSRHERRGTLDGWKAGVASLAPYSSRLILSVCSAFAAPLLSFTAAESGGFHLFGPSASGKTTCLQAATSVLGPATRRDLYTWNSTAVGLEEVAAGHCDCVLCLDEIAQVQSGARETAKKVRDAAFMLAGGRGRLRSTIYGQKLGVRDLTWNLMLLSTGEKAIFELASEADVARLKGEEVRLIDVPAIADDQLGIYEALPAEFVTPARLSDGIAAACASDHGVAFPEFIRQVSAQIETITSSIRTKMDQFAKASGVPEDGWERRFASRFALAFAAGVIAADFGIVPWKAGLIGTRIRACYLAARGRIPDAGKLRSDGFDRLRAKLRGEARILRLDRSGHKVNWSVAEAQAAEAFLNSGPPGVHYLIQPETFVSWFDSPLQANLVLDELDRLGYLIKPRPNLRTLQIAIHGIRGRRRYYAVRQTILTST